MILAKTSSAKHIEIELNHGIDADLLPPYLSKAEIEKLPEDAGVFYFRDEVGKVLYLEGVKNIRRKVINEFSIPSVDPEHKRMFELVRTIDYELSGNELIARLIAYRELKSHTPEFNKKPKIQTATHGIFLDPDEQGYTQLKIHLLDWPNGEAVMRFPSKGAANKVLERIIGENNLHSWFAVRSRMKEKGLDEKKLMAFNTSMEKAVRKYLYRHPNFFIIGEGIHPEEHSAVWIEKNTYKGFGFFNPEITPAVPENLKEIIHLDEDDTETQKIIRTQMRKMKNMKVLNY